MPLYIYQAAYTPESLAAQIRKPDDRFEAVRPAFEAMGGKIVVGGYPFGEYDMLVVIEAPDDTTAAGFALAVVAAVRSGRPARPACSTARSGSRPCGRRKAPPTSLRASHRSAAAKSVQPHGSRRREEQDRAHSHGSSRPGAAPSLSRQAIPGRMRDNA